MQNNIRNIESNLIVFYDKMCNYINCGIHETISPMIIQNTKCLKSGDYLEISAGIGAFSRAAMPQITIDNKLIDSDFGGLVKYRIKAPNKSGKYFIPIKIKYTKPDGTKYILEKQIEYTVDE